MSTTNGKKDSAAERAQKGAQQGGAIAGPYGAAGGLLDGYLGGPIYNMLNPDEEGWGGLTDDMRRFLGNINLPQPQPINYLQYTPTQYNVKDTTQGVLRRVQATGPGGKLLFNKKTGDPVYAKNEDGTDKYHRIIPKGSKDLYGSKLSQVPYQSTVDPSSLRFNPQAGMNDLSMMTGFTGTLPEQARQETLWNEGSREAIAPGTRDMMRQGGSVINDWLQGKVSQDVAQSIQSAAASNYGGSYNPFGNRSQTGSSAMLKNLGLTSTQMQAQGVSAAQAWQQLADQLITKPSEEFARATSLAGQRYAYDALATNTALEQDSRRYGAAMQNNIIKHSPNPRATGLLNDTLKLNAVNDQANQFTALNQQQTDLVNSQMFQQYGMNQANLDMAKMQALLGGIPGQMAGQNYGNAALGSAALSAGAQVGSSFLSSYFANRGSGSGAVGSSTGTPSATYSANATTYPGSGGGYQNSLT